MHVIQKRPSRPKYPSKRKHGNIPCAASDYRLSYIGRHKSLIDLLIDLAFEGAVPSRRYAIAIAIRHCCTCLSLLTMLDSVLRLPPSAFRGWNFGCGRSKVYSRACAIFSSLIYISPDSLATVCFAADFSWYGNGAYSRGGGARGLCVRE